LEKRVTSGLIVLILATAMRHNRHWRKLGYKESWLDYSLVALVDIQYKAALNY
jgi:hypothetical protein